MFVKLIVTFTHFEMVVVVLSSSTLCSAVYDFTSLNLKLNAYKISY